MLLTWEIMRFHKPHRENSEEKSWNQSVQSHGRNTTKRKRKAVLCLDPCKALLPQFAHYKSNLNESVLLKALRGVWMRHIPARSVKAESGYLPYLRSMILLLSLIDYLTFNNIQYHQAESNASPIYLGNCVRNEMCSAHCRRFDAVRSAGARPKSINKD